MSLVSLIPKCAGNNKLIPLHEFFEAIEGSARVGNWSEADRIQIAVLKLMDAARAFYNASVELHEPNTTWAMSKPHFKGVSAT